MMLVGQVFFPLAAQAAPVTMSLNIELAAASQVFFDIDGFIQSIKSAERKDIDMTITQGTETRSYHLTSDDNGDLRASDFEPVFIGDEPITVVTIF